MNLGQTMVVRSDIEGYNFSREDNHRVQRRRKDFDNIPSQTGRNNHPQL